MEWGKRQILAGTDTLIFFLQTRMSIVARMQIYQRYPSPAPNPPLQGRKQFDNASSLILVFAFLLSFLSHGPLYHSLISYFLAVLFNAQMTSS
ncbi:hypothetical protein GE21DRAFT_1071664 [Neurospora crassa]|nr:hypothetical protein GE21DRAFT_1071664 [Neurospora crassa]